jgi:surface polysaccharide O-acyltransferase-like enzyme
MLTGATLMEYRKRYDTKQFFKKRLLKILVPFLLWSLIALFWKVNLGQMQLPKNLAELVSHIINTDINAVYWFFVPLICIYLALPVLSLLSEYKKYLWYIVGLGFVSIFLLPHILPLIGITWNTYWEFPLAGGGLILYPILGYLLSKQDFTKFQRLSIYALGILGASLTIIPTLVLSHMEGQLIMVFWGYTTFGHCLVGIAVFVFFKQVRWDQFFSSEKTRNVLVKLSSASFGVYLIHIFIIYYVQFLPIIGHYGMAFRTIGCVVVYGLCLVVVLAIKRVPLLKRLFP